MIEKLTRPNSYDFVYKINEIISYVNGLTDNVTELIDKVQQLADNGLVLSKKVNKNVTSNIDVGEIAYYQKQNSDLQDEVEKLQKQLDIAVSALKYIDEDLIGTNSKTINKALNEIKELEEE